MRVSARTYAAASLAAALLWAAPAPAQTVRERLPACLACHGENGQSETPEVPSLGAQPPFYLLTQLVLFRERIRVVEPMNEMTKELSDDDLRQAADLVSKLPPPQPAAGPNDSARMERTQALVREHRCNFCHNPDFSGIENVPRLAGQREDYLLKALRGYKDNTRRGYDAQMADVVAPLTDADMTDLAYFLARAK
jgi:cytochrome c553